MISNNYDKTITVNRMVEYTDTSGFDKIRLENNGTIQGHLQMLSNDLTGELGLAFGKSFIVFCDLDADVRESDQLIIDSISYKVSKVWDLYDGINKHKELIIVKEE